MKSLEEMRQERHEGVEQNLFSMHGESVLAKEKKRARRMKIEMVKAHDPRSTIRDPILSPSITEGETADSPKDFEATQAVC